MGKFNMIKKEVFGFLLKNKKKIISNFLFFIVMSTASVYADDFLATAVDNLTKLAKAIGIGLGIWGFVNLAEGYGSDNPAAKNQGMKQLVAGVAIFVLGPKLLESLKGAFS